MVTGFTDSDLDVEDSAFRFYLAADSLVIEVVSFRAFNADTILPDSASEVVVEDFH